MRNLNNTLRTSILLLLLLCASYSALAHDFEVDGIYYNKTSYNTVAVTYQGSVYHQNTNRYIGSVTIPSSVTYGGETYSVTSIGDNAFNRCGMLTSVTIPHSVTTIDSYAFNNCASLTEISVKNGNSVYDSRNNCNAIIETASNKLIAGCQNTVIYNTITTIGKNAFCGCTRLTSVTIPNSVTHIETGAFYGCTGLASVTIPKSITIIDDYNPFMSCTGLKSVIVDSGNMFYDSRGSCNAIIETASNKLITGCQNTVIPNSVSKIGANSFLGCTGLTSVTIPNSVTHIYACAFADCKNLLSVTIPNSVTYIGHDAFMACTGMTSVTIPKSVTRIDAYPFRGCSGLKEITVNEGNSVYDSRNNCNAIIETASNKLIAGCQNTIIPNTVTCIDGYTFDSCYGITNLTIPNSVTQIQDYAFYNCSGLTSVTCLARTPPTIGDNCFSLSINSSTIYLNAPLYVPKESVVAYQSANGWKKFIHIVGIEVEPQHGDVNGDGVVNISDLNNVVNDILAGIGDPSMDVNGDGSVNISDINIIVQTILSNN